MRAMAPPPRPATRKPLLAGLIGVAVLTVAGTAWLAWPRTQLAADGATLGALPRGVSRSDLNVVLITLDTLGRTISGPTATGRPNTASR